MTSKENVSIPTSLIIANMVTIATLVPTVLHQLGALDHLRDPPFGLFDSDGITESKAAHPLGIPGGLLVLGSFGLTLCLVVAAQSQPAVRKYLALKLAGDTAIAGVNVVRQVVSFRKLCLWCTATAVCAFAAAAFAKPLLRQELRRTKPL